jgi:hypothetical protein
VLPFIRGIDSLLILAPGEAKGEFSKHIKAKKLHRITIELETADRMTDREVEGKGESAFRQNSFWQIGCGTKNGAGSRTMNRIEARPEEVVDTYSSRAPGRATFFV